MRVRGTIAWACVLAAVVSAAPHAGLVSLRELGCKNCHALRPEFSASPASNLTGAGSRLRRDWIEQAISRHGPGSPGVSSAEAAALTGLLASSRAEVPSFPAGSTERGRALFSRIGCVPCHGASAPSGAKYQSGALAAFLRDPLASRPAGKMPRFALSEQDAADLEAFVKPGAREPGAEAEPSVAAIRLFSSKGCANCHRLEIEGRLPAPLAPTEVSHLDRGCLAPDSARYRLTARQREAIRAALSLARVEPAELLDARLAALNCGACHARNGKGGPTGATAAAFGELEDTDLGDEGRFPPPLTAAGYKLVPEALRNAIRGESKMHPKMAVRMPDFGAANAAELERLFGAADMPAGFSPVERTGRNVFGRELAGIQGLGCINCHDLRGRKSLGIGASDLALAPHRLRVEWFRDFLIDPARFHPGTRMPSFWPGGKASNAKVLRGDTGRQIDSLWVYLNEIDQTRLPAGLEEKGAYELKPADKPIVLRAFMKDAGTHAIAIGYPGGRNAAFDSDRVRWALVWKGRFVDAESVWEDRFNPPMVPLGTDVRKLPDSTPFSDSPERAASEGYRFGGYKLDRAGAPSFLYEFNGARISDRLAPSEGGFTRIVEVDTPRRLWFRRHDGSAIEVAPGRHTLRSEIAW